MHYSDTITDIKPANATTTRSTVTLRQTRVYKMDHIKHSSRVQDAERKRGNTEKTFSEFKSVRLELNHHLRI